MKEVSRSQQGWGSARNPGGERESTRGEDRWEEGEKETQRAMEGWSIAPVSAAIRSSLAPGKEWRGEEKDGEMEDEHSALHSQWPRPAPCLSTCTPPPPPLLSFMLPSLHPVSNSLSPCRPHPLPPLLLLLPLFLSSSPLTFLPYFITNWLFIIFLFVTRSKNVWERTRWAPIVVLFISRSQTYQEQIKYSGMNKKPVTILDYRVFQQQRKVWHTVSICCLLALFLFTNTHTHTLFHQQFRQHLSACPSMSLQPSDFFIFSWKESRRQQAATERTLLHLRWDGSVEPEESSTS